MFLKVSSEVKAEATQLVNLGLLSSLNRATDTVAI